MPLILATRTKREQLLDAYKIAALLRGGNLPEAYLYPAAMRATWDLLRRYHQLETKSTTAKSFGIS